jgi:hypothetical protein
MIFKYGNKKKLMLINIKHSLLEDSMFRIKCCEGEKIWRN